VTLLIAAGPKVAAFALIMRLLVEGAAAGHRLADDAGDPVDCFAGHR
jgi:NADH:ubiquinone oxidoreductase subunit 2 (subunit N)